VREGEGTTRGVSRQPDAQGSGSVVRRFSLDTLAGSLLQVVKQGLSVAHSGPASAPAGRQVGQQGLATVVCQARNQSMHREAGTLRAPVVACFDTLKADCGAQYASPTTRNLAFQVVQVLGWRTADDVLADLALLT